MYLMYTGADVDNVGITESIQHLFHDDCDGLTWPSLAQPDGELLSLHVVLFVLFLCCLLACVVALFVFCPCWHLLSNCVVVCVCVCVCCFL